MPDFLGTLFGDVNVALLSAVNYLLVVFGTQILKWVLNRSRWLFVRNPLCGWDTNRVMPVVALALGLGMGVVRGPAPGLADNLQSGFIYGAAAVLSHQVIKRTVMGQ